MFSNTKQQTVKKTSSITDRLEKQIKKSLIDQEPTVEEYLLEKNNEKEQELNKDLEELEEEKKLNNKEYDKKLKDLIDAGGFHIEGIAEIRAIIILIQNCPEEVKPIQENMGKCLEILVNMSNQYLQLYKKDNINLWNDDLDDDLDGETDQNKND
tara:strand:- start:158 stop:622 length:465 start_codon:yes stop_codon:yes gene_type:complete